VSFDALLSLFETQKLMKWPCSMEGFIVFDYAKEYPRALKDLAQWLSEGKIKRKETIIKGGLDQAENALRDLYKGVNTGKSTRRLPLTRTIFHP
jgi:NADPH-dependent curcumin reductase CurA